MESTCAHSCRLNAVFVWQVIYLQAGQDMCLAVENQVSCADQTRQGAVVCAWRNVMLQPCQPQTEAAGTFRLFLFSLGVVQAALTQG